MDIQMLQQYLDRNCFDDLFRKLYGNAENTLKYQNRRYRNALKNFAAKYPGRSDVCIFSAPGRTEIGGNHTDHQHGIVLAGAVNLDAVAIVSFHNEGVIRLKSKGYPELKIHLNDTAKHPGDSGTAAIIRGIANRYQENGIHIGGFDMYCVSDVISGSGISSSAAFEILLCTIIDHRYNNSSSSPLEIARIA